jgi:hypothetical protein
MQDENLPLNFVLKHVWLFWIHISSTKLDHAEPNQSVHYQTITPVAERMKHPLVLQLIHYTDDTVQQV